MSSVWGQWHLTVVQKSQSLSSSKLSTNVLIIVKNEKNKNQPITVCFFISHFSSFVYDHFIFWNGHCMRSLSSHLSSTFSAVLSTKSLTSLSLSFTLTLLHTQPHTITIQCNNDAHKHPAQHLQSVQIKTLACMHPHTNTHTHTKLAVQQGYPVRYFLPKNWTFFSKAADLMGVLIS